MRPNSSKQSICDGTTPTATYYYHNVTNAKGKLVKVSSSVSTTEYTSFDISGRVTGHKQTTDGAAYTTAYTYNLGGGLMEETYPSTRVVKNVLDADGDLSIVESKKNSASGYWHYADTFAYTAAGAVNSLQLGNGHWESTVFNSRLQPTQIGLGTVQNGTDKLKLNFDYGTTTNNGNVQSQTITVPTVGLNNGFTAVQAYTYDELNRLSTATETSNGSQTWKQSFIFDRYGNRNFDRANTTMPASFVNPAVTDPSVNTANNRLSSTGYTFDNAGNMTVDAGGQNYTYDAENKQTQVTNGSGTLGQYFYDGDGKRVKKYVPSTGEITVFVYDAAGKQIAEYSTVVADASTAKVAYLTSDHLGSPRINTDQNGAVISRHDYHPFGEEINGLGGRTTGLNYGDDTVRKQFTAYERDNETNLDYAEARMYGSSLGRFTSPDPLLSSGDNSSPQTWNRYSYGLNNPTKYTDPTGFYVYDSNVSDADKRRLDQAYKDLEKARDHYKQGSSKYNAINDALNALGKPGDENGVTVSTYKDPANPGFTSGNLNYKDGLADGTASIAVNIDISRFKDTDEGKGDLSGAFGHEGTHVKDDKSEAQKLKGLTSFQVDDASASGRIMISPITEVDAYRVSSYVAEAMQTIYPSAKVESTSVNGSKIWDKGWKVADEETKRNAGIKGALESSSGSYKYKFTGGKTDSIDDPKFWRPAKSIF